jgi:hypothetical protein
MYICSLTENGVVAHPANCWELNTPFNCVPTPVSAMHHIVAGVALITIWAMLALIDHLTLAGAVSTAVAVTVVYLFALAGTGRDDGDNESFD